MSKIQFADISVKLLLFWQFFSQRFLSRKAYLLCYRKNCFLQVLIEQYFTICLKNAHKQARLKSFVPSCIFTNIYDAVRYTLARATLIPSLILRFRFFQEDMFRCRRSALGISCIPLALCIAVLQVLSPSPKQKVLKLLPRQDYFNASNRCSLNIVLCKC